MSPAAAGAAIRVFAGGLDLGGQRGELVAAAMADDREWLRVPDQLERQVIRLTEPVTARNGRDTQQRSIYAS